VKGSVRASPDAHDQYADEQLTTIQKRILLIEFLFMVGLLLVKEDFAPTREFKPLIRAVFCLIFNIFAEFENLILKNRENLEFSNQLWYN